MDHAIYALLYLVSYVINAIYKVVWIVMEDLFQMIKACVNVMLMNIMTQF